MGEGRTHPADSGVCTKALPPETGLQSRPARAVQVEEQKPDEMQMPPFPDLPTSDMNGAAAGLFRQPAPPTPPLTPPPRPPALERTRPAPPICPHAQPPPQMHAVAVQKLRNNAWVSQITPV